MCPSDDIDTFYRGRAEDQLVSLALCDAHRDGRQILAAIIDDEDDETALPAHVSAAERYPFSTARERQQHAGEATRRLMAMWVSCRITIYVVTGI